MKKNIKAVTFSMFILLAGISSYSTEAKKILDKKCALCHVTPEPEKYTKDRWKSLVKKMAPRANLSDYETKMIIKLNTKK